MSDLIIYTPGTVRFPEFEDYIAKAQAVAEVLDSTVLTEDNIQEVRLSLANARKIVNALETRRKEVKNAILEPYNVLEKQVKIITKIINEADDNLRTKVREMEEKEREDKKAVLRELWDKRISLYTFPEYISDPFDRWIQPQHTNKTYPISNSEKDMTAWMEQRERDCQSIMGMEAAGYIMDSYATSLDLASAISEGLARKRKVEEINTKVPESISEPCAVFYITGESSINFAELLLRDNKINYRKEMQ
mgnify:CR=1 FL=1